MRRIFIFFVIACITLSGNALSEETTEFNVESENGEKLIFTEVRAGHLKTIELGKHKIISEDSQGNPVYQTEGYKAKLIETSEIPLVINDKLGFVFRIPEVEEGDSVIIALVVELPSPV